MHKSLLIESIANFILMLLGRFFQKVRDLQLLNDVHFFSLHFLIVWDRLNGEVYVQNRDLVLDYVLVLMKVSYRITIKWHHEHLLWERGRGDLNPFPHPLILSYGIAKTT